MSSGRALATFDAGCFWRVEAGLQQVPGELELRPGRTGPAEVVQVVHDRGRVAQAHFADPGVTGIALAGEFHPAEGHPADHFRRNREQGHRRLVIAPELGELGLEP